MDVETIKMLHSIAVIGGPSAVILAILVVTPGGRELLKGLFTQKKGESCTVSQERCDKLMEEYRRVASEAVGRANEDTRKSIESVHERVDKLYEALMNINK